MKLRQMNDYTYLYLHGFSSSPDSKKAIFFKDFFNHYNLNINIPDLNNGDFSKLRLSKSIDLIHNFSNTTHKLRIIASSFGALASSVYAFTYPNYVDSLILLAPAFNLGFHFQNILGKQNIKKWRETGKFHFQNDNGKMIPISWDFINDLNNFPHTPLVKCKTIIIHGKKDLTIPISSSYDYIQNHNHIKLIEVDDGHLLSKSYEIIAKTVENFWFSLQ